MHLDSRTELANAPLAPPEWSLDLLREGSLFLGVVKRSHIPMCRVSIAAGDLSEADARTALADKARNWIAEFLARPAAAPDAAAPPRKSPLEAG